MIQLAEIVILQQEMSALVWKELQCGKQNMLKEGL